MPPRITPCITIQYACRVAGQPGAALLEKWAAAALEGQPEQGELVIRVVDEQESARLNGRWRGVYRPTNVLSFPAAPVPGPAGAPLGDVMLCAPVMARQARQWGVAAPAHWAHMEVHGILHLLGHDHQQQQAARRMEALEGEILRRLNFPSPHPEAESPPETR